MTVKKHIALLVLLVVSMATAAQDVSQRGCRRGIRQPRPALTRAAGKMLGPGGDFYQGHRRQLVVLAAYSDYDFQGDEAQTLATWDKVLNAEGLHEAPYEGSVHDYFMAQSYGLFQLYFDLQYVQLASGRDRYASTADDDENSQYLVNDIVDELLTRDIPWSEYDWNGDGRINQLLIIYAGKGQNDGGDSHTVWAHQWLLSDHIDPATSQPCPTRTVSHDGIDYVIDSYCAVPELSGYHDSTFGTLCHEYTHCFGFPDYYYGSINYVGKWDLMDIGNYNGDGCCPPGYSAHQRWLMGWLTPQELTQPVNVTDMAPLHEQPQAYLIRNDGYQDEYYMLENRQPDSWDASLPGSGLVIAHIDYDAELWNGTTPGFANKPDYQRYSIFAANNNRAYSSYNASKWAYPYNGNNQLTNTSSPASTLLHDNADGTRLMSKPVTGITVSNGVAAFAFMGGTSAVTAPTVSTQQGPLQVLYRMGPLVIVRRPDGTVVKQIAAPPIH